MGNHVEVREKVVRAVEKPRTDSTGNTWRAGVCFIYLVGHLRDSAGDLGARILCFKATHIK